MSPGPSDSDIHNPSCPKKLGGSSSHPVQRQGDGSFGLSNPQVRVEKREEQDSIWPSIAKHLAKMSPKRGVSIQHSHVPWGSQSFREVLLKSLISQKVARGPKVTLFQTVLAQLEQWTETPPTPKALGSGGLSREKRPVSGSDAVVYLVPFFREYSDSLFPFLPPWVMPVSWGPQLRLHLPTCLSVQL